MTQKDASSPLFLTLEAEVLSFGRIERPWLIHPFAG